MLHDAAVGGCNNGSSSYNIGGYNGSGGYNGGGSYNVGGYTMVVCSTLHKQWCWEFGASHSCVCIISEGP